MGGNAIGQRKEAPEPSFFGLSKSLDRHPVIGPTHDRANGDDNHIQQLISLVTLDPWILERSKMLDHTGRAVLWHNSSCLRGCPASSREVTRVPPPTPLGPTSS